MGVQEILLAISHIRAAVIVRDKNVCLCMFVLAALNATQSVNKPFGRNGYEPSAMRPQRE